MKWNERERFGFGSHRGRLALVLNAPCRARPFGISGCGRCSGGSDQADTVPVGAFRDPARAGALPDSRQAAGAPVDPASCLDRHDSGWCYVGAAAFVENIKEVLRW